MEVVITQETTIRTTHMTENTAESIINQRNQRNIDKVVQDRRVVEATPGLAHL